MATSKSNSEEEAVAPSDMRRKVVLVLRVARLVVVVADRNEMHWLSRSKVLVAAVGGERVVEREGAKALADPDKRRERSAMRLIKAILWRKNRLN
jgi:hypothetical protein